MVGIKKLIEYYEALTKTGESFRATIFGSSLTPEIIANQVNTKANMLTAEVILDKSLSVSDVNAIIANYKNASNIVTAPFELTPITSKLDKANINSPWNNIQNSNSNSNGLAKSPKMVVFNHVGNNKRRVIFKTRNGNIEVLVPYSAVADNVLNALKSKIKSGALFELDQTQLMKSDEGLNILTTEFKINQENPLSGRFLIIEPRTKYKISRNIKRRIRDIFISVFKKILGDNSSNKVIFADYILEVKKNVESIDQEWIIETKITIEGDRLRFVHLILPKSKDISIEVVL